MQLATGSLTVHLATGSLAVHLVTRSSTAELDYFLTILHKYDIMPNVTGQEPLN